MKQLIEEQREDFKKNKKTYWDTFGNLATEELISIHSEYLKQLIDGLIERIKSTQDKYHNIDKKTKEDEYSGGGTCRQCSKRKDSLEIEEIVNILKDLRSQIK